jgi:GNAT superfamily N-acetyltransferase
MEHSSLPATAFSYSSTSAFPNLVPKNLDLGQAIDLPPHSSFKPKPLRGSVQCQVAHVAVIIRRATAEDAPALSSLMHNSAAYQGRYARILDGYELTAQQMQNDHVFLATEREALQGFYSLTGLSSEPELDLLFVVDSSQGSGIGAALFEHMRGIARELGLSSIKIVSHPPAVGFYTRMGAKVVGLKAHPAV